MTATEHRVDEQETEAWAAGGDVLVEFTVSRKSGEVIRFRLCPGQAIDLIQRLSGATRDALLMPLSR